MIKRFDTIDEFVKKNRRSIVIYFFFILFAYGIKLFHVIISIDTESIISVPEELYRNGWLSMGRFGALLLKKMLGTYWFNPYVASFMMIITLLAGGLIWMYLFSNLNKKTSRISWIFPSVFFTAPIMAEQSSFLLQAYEVTVCIGLVGLSLILFYKGVYYKKKYYYLFTCICIIFSFATYQSTVILFITGAVASFLLFYDYESGEDTPDFLKIKATGFRYWGTIGKLILLFVLSYLFYTIANKIVMGALGIQTEAYINDQVHWGKDSVTECIVNIGLQVKKILLGKTIYYNVALAILMIFFLVYICFRWKQKRKAYYIFFLASLALCVCPFIMVLLLGGSVSVRTEWTIPFVTAFLAMYLTGCFIDSEHFTVPLLLKRLALLLAFVMGMQQSMVTARIYYTEYAKYQQDLVMAIKISDRIEELNLGDSPQAPVTFIGAKPTHHTPSMYTEEEIELSGRSLFSISFGTFHGTFVMRNFMKSVGYDYELPTQDQVKRAEEISTAMGTWPDTDSVRYEEGVIVVRLS